MVSHGASGQECWGDTGGSGFGYVNACIHSGTNSGLSGNTVWYNYATASAETISNSSNINTATESICPKNWTLPTVIQITNNRNSLIFNPVTGGHWSNGVIDRETEKGYWWGREAYVNNLATWRRYTLDYDGSLLNGNGSRTTGNYIRCVSEEKTVLDLTYMQDMTPAIVGFFILFRE